MRVQRIAPAVAIVAAGCATMENGTTQRLPVTSDPPGARVLLDGRPVGVTPTRITVSRRSREPVVEVVMDGFSPAVHRLQRREDWMPIFWSAFTGLGVVSVVGRLLLPDDGTPDGFWQTIGVFGLGAVPGIVDYGTGAAFQFPRTGVSAVLNRRRSSATAIPRAWPIRRSASLSGVQRPAHAGELFVTPAGPAAPPHRPHRAAPGSGRVTVRRGCLRPPMSAETWTMRPAPRRGPAPAARAAPWPRAERHGQRGTSDSCQPPFRWRPPDATPARRPGRTIPAFPR